MRLTACLRQAQSVTTPKRKSGFRVPSGRRTHITSEQLCDDVLEFLKPSLPQPGTCDIIDLNPGQCLWSRKLNDLLKPRRHILVEPQLERYAEPLNSLISQPGSCYRYAVNLHTALNRNGGLLSEDVYQFQEHHKSASAAQYVTNEKLLITANLSGDARTAKGFKKSEATQFLNNYYRSLFNRDNYFHKYGLVRLLAWIGEDARRSIMPPTVNVRTKQSLQLESAFTIDQVAGPSQFLVAHGHQGRWYDLDVENQQEVRERQRQLGFVIPAHRDQPDPLPPFIALKPVIDEVRKNRSLYPLNPTPIQRLLELDDYLIENEPDWRERYEATAKDGFTDVESRYERATSSKQRTFRRLMNHLRSRHNDFLKVRDFVWEQRQLAKRLQEGYLNGWFSPSTGLPMEGSHMKEGQKLIQGDVLTHEAFQRIKLDSRRLIRKAGDDYRCYDAPARILSWNRRQHEPLLVRNEEFHSRKPLTLFDFQPNPQFPEVLDTVEKQICFDYVCTTLMMAEGETVRQCIKRIVPSGDDLFLEGVPELRDISKGGWWDLDRARIRGLHHDLFLVLAKAFEKWPGRPPVSQLMGVYRGVFDADSIK